MLKTFFETPSEHRQGRRRSQRKMHKKSSKKTKGVFVFGNNNSSSSSVNSDMAYGMGFIKKPKSRGGGLSPTVGAAAASASRRERSEGRPVMPRRQTDEEIREIGRKLQDVARMQNRADLDRRGKGSWESYQRQSSSGLEGSSRGLAPSKHGRHRHHTSSSDDDWESASEGEDSDGMSALAYGHSPIPTPQPAKSSMSRMSTASAIAAGSALVAGSAIAASRASDRKSTVVDPKLFGPTNSLRDFVNTPCGFNDNGGAHGFPLSGPDVQGYADSAESASVEARPLQRVFPLQTSDPGHMEATRASGSVLSSQQNYSTIVRDQVYSTTSVSNHADPVPIQAPKPIAPVPSRIYDDERIRDVVSHEPVEHRRKPTSDNKIYAETALVGAGVAALGAAILAGRDKGKGKEDDSEQTHGKHERYGHDDHRQENTKVEDARKAQELRLMQEIERLENALGRTNKAREQRRRDSKRDRDSGSLVDAPADERRETEISLEEERDHERERDRRRRDRQPKRSEPSDYDNRVSAPSVRPALLENDTQYCRVGGPNQPGAIAPVDVFQFQVPDDAFTTGDTLPKAPSPYIIDVTPSPTPTPEQRRESRQGSMAEETRDAHRIYEKAHHSTAPIPEVVMAAAIGAVTHSRRRDEEEEEEEEDRGRTNARTADTIQEEANKVYAARRVAEREIRSRSRSKSHDDPAPRIVTPPEMQNRPPKNPFSGANADFRFDMEMSPTQLLGYWPEVAPVRDPSAERPRPVLNLVMPTPAQTPTPERQKEASAVKEPEPVEDVKKEMPSVVFRPRGEVVEVAEVYEEPPTQPTSKRVSWGPSETKQYEEHSPERPHEHSSPSEQPRKGFGGWGAIAAAVTGASVGAALANDHGPKSPKGDVRNRDEHPPGSRSPPKERPVLSTDMSSRVFTEEAEELPPAPGPKPASPRNSQQMPGAFSDDIDFAATLAAGLEHSGFDPEIVIDNPQYHRRDSPPGSNEPYQQPFAESVPDLGIYNVDDGHNSLSHERGYVIGEVDVPGIGKAAPLEDLEDVSRNKSKKDKRSSYIYDDIEVIEEPQEAEPNTSKLSKKERRKFEKAAQAAKITEEEAQVARAPAVEVGDDEWADPPTSKKSKKAKKAKRSSVAWDDADTPVNDTRVSVPVNAFDDIKDTKSVDDVDDWDMPKKSKRDSRGYDLPEDDLPDREKRDHRGTEFYEPVDRDVASVVTESRYDPPPNGPSNGDDDHSVASAPSGSKRDSKRSSGGFWGLLGGKEQQQPKKDNAGTLGAGAGLVGVAAAAMAAAVAGSDAAGASSGHKQEEPHVERDVSGEIEVFEDPEIAPRTIKPAIDPQYGDLLPLPPSPGEGPMDFDEEDTLPALPDSRPTTPPGQAPAVVRERDSSMKRPIFASHVRRTSAAEAPLRSPSHTAIPIQFRMGHRSLPATSPATGSRSSPVVQSPPTPAPESPPIPRRNEFSPTYKRHSPRPTSWDSSREIKPLYLLERSAKPPSDDEQHDEVADMTPVPQMEASVPEGQLKYEQAVGLGVDASPLVVDADVARAADYGSQEPTPTGLKPSEPIPSLVREVETTPIGFPSSSSLPESSYATPGEFPRDVETKSSPRLELIATKAPDVEEGVKPEKQSYFPSALSMLPATTLAGVGILLSRGKRDDDDAHAIGDDHNSKAAVEEPLIETATELPYETSQIDQKGLADSEFESIDKGDTYENFSEPLPSNAVDLQSPADFQDAQTESPSTESPEVQPEATEPIPETPVDTTDWAVESGSKKKKKKGKKKQSVSNAPQLAPTTDSSMFPSSKARQDLALSGDADLETVKEVPINVEPLMESAAAQQLETDSFDTTGVESSAFEQSTPPEPNVFDITEESQLQSIRNLNTSHQEMRNDIDPGFAETLHDSAMAQPDTVSEGMLAQTPSQEEAVIVSPGIEEPNFPQFETGGHLDAALALPVDSEQAQSTNISTEPVPQKTESVETDWSTPSSKSRSKKKKRQSVSFAEDIVDSAVLTSSGDTTFDDVQPPGLQQSSPTALEPAEPPREQLQELLDAPIQPLDPEVVHHDVAQESQTEPQKTTEELASDASTGMQLDEISREIPAEEVPILSREQTDEIELELSQILADEPAAVSSEYQESQQDTNPAPVAAEEEYPIISKKSTKNKKRKNSKAIDEPVGSSVSAPSTDSEKVDLPIDLAHQTHPPASELAQPTVLPSESNEVAFVPEDALPLGRDGARSPAPADEVVRSAETIEDQPLSAQHDSQIAVSPWESQETPLTPTLTSEDSPVQPGIVPLGIKPSDANKEPRLELDASKPPESEVILGGTTQPSDALEPIAPPALAPPAQDSPLTSTLSPEVQQGSFGSHDHQEPAYEGEVTGHEESMRTTGLEKSDFKQEKDHQKPPDEEEAVRREAEAAQIQEEEVEVARLQLKRKPSKKDKSRLKDLRARAQQRAEEAEAVVASLNSAKDSNKPALELETIQASDLVENHPMETTMVKDPVALEDIDRTTNSADSKESEPVWETPQPAGQNIEDFRSANEGAQAELASQPRQLEEDPEEFARREAEAEKIRDEESELAGLKIKRKPSKKDKSRIKVLQANVEDREREAEASAHHQTEQQGPVTQDTHGEAQFHLDLGQNIATGPAEGIPQPPSGLEVLKDNNEPEADKSAELALEDNNTNNADTAAESHNKVSVLGHSISQSALGADEAPVVPNEPSQISEHHVGDGNESMTQLGNATPKDIDTPPSAFSQPVGKSEGPSDGMAKDITEHQPLSLAKPKSIFGGWGVIAAAVTGASVGVALGKDDQPESQVPAGDPSVAGIDETERVDSHTRDIKTEPDQPELQEDFQPHAGDNKAGSHEGLIPTEIVDIGPPRFEGSAPNMEFSQLDKDITIRELAPDQTVTIEPDPDFEWVVPSKKSKKDKKKKRKNTISGNSGEDSGLATPIEPSESSEPMSVPKPAEVGNSDVPTSQEKDVLPAVDHEIASIRPIETVDPEQREFASASIAQDDLAEDVVPSTFDKAIADSKKELDGKVDGSGHLSAVDVAQTAIADEVGSNTLEPGQNVPLGEMMDLPARLMQSMRAAPPTTGLVHNVSNIESMLSDQGPSEGLGHYESERHQLSSSADNPVPMAEATEHTTLRDQDTVPAVETSKDLPLETEPIVSIMDEPRQPQTDEFSWAPVRKKDKKKKKKRGSVAWSEPDSGAQTPIGEDVPEHSTRGISQEKSLPTQPAQQHEDLSEARDSSPQLDDWSASMSSEKGKQAVSSSWDPESISPGRLNDEPRGIHDVAEDVAGSSGDRDTVPQPAEPIQPYERLQPESGSVSERDLTVGQDEDSHHPLASENAGQLTSKTITQSGAQDFSSHQPASEPDLESKIEESEDIVIVTGGTVPDTDLTLRGEVAAFQPPLALSPPPTIMQDPIPSQEVPMPDIASQAKHLDDPNNAAAEEVTDQDAPVASERSVEQPTDHEPIPTTDLARTVEAGEDTILVAGGKVADDVSDPWTFEAAHGSPTFTKSDLDTKTEDGDDTMIVAGGKTLGDLAQLSHTQNDSQLVTEPTDELLDMDRPASRPQSPAPWGEEDYSTSTSQRHIDEEFDRPVARFGSPESRGDEGTIFAGRDNDLAVQRTPPRPDSPVPSDDNNSAFVTPFEDAPALAVYANPNSNSRQDEEQFSKWAPTKGSQDNHNDQDSSIIRSLDHEPEPELSTSVTEAPHLEEAVDQQIFVEPVEAPDTNDPVSGKAVEPATEDFDDWAPKKLTKKEKRKIKKNSISILEPQVSANSIEELQPGLASESLDQTPTNSDNFGDVQQGDPSQSDSGQLEKTAEAIKPMSKSDFDRPFDSSGPNLPDGSAKAVEWGETTLDRHTNPSFSVPEEAAAATAAAAVAVPSLTRKMSKKEKRRAKKASSSWKDDAVETGQLHASGVEDLQDQEAQIVASPIEDLQLTREAALDVSPIKLQPNQEVTANSETSTAAKAVADDEWAAPLSRKKSKGKKKKGKQLSVDSVSIPQTPATEESPPPASAEGEEPPTPADHTVEETHAQSADNFVVSSSPLRAEPAEILEASGGSHFEAKSPATLGTDLQQMPSAAPSPDPWESEDYFKPKTAGSSPTDPPEEPFGKLEVHPAFTRGLNTTSETRSREERPLVGLGLIHRHSSIFQEDDGHTPKLLTLTSDNASIESLAIEDASQPGASTNKCGVPQSQDSSELRFVDAALPDTEGASTADLSLNQRADMPLAQEPTVTSPSAHPPRRFPLSPRLSPRPSPNDPPKSPIPDEIKLSQRGSVAMLAQRFGGKRKKVSKYVDKRAPVEDDLFDDPAMWEGAERKAVDGSRIEEDAGDFWAVEDTSLDEESEPDVHPGQGSTPPAQSMGTKHGDDNVSATHSSPGPDAGRFTPELPGKAIRQEEVPLEPLVESPVLGSQASNDLSSPEPPHTAHAVRSPSPIETSQTIHQSNNIADTWDLIGARRQRDDLPRAISASPTSDRGLDVEESVLSSLEPEHDESRNSFVPAVDFGRSVSRGLPPVQEEPLEEEGESGKHTTSLTVTTPDINRDSGFATDSPNQVWTRRFDDAQQRDSGVHMRDYRNRSPGLHSSRGGSPEPKRVSRSSVEDEGARLDGKPKRSPLARYERPLREDTPVLEAQEPPITPEPQKPRSDGSRTRKYPNLGPGAMAGGAALLAAQKSGAESPSLSSAEGQRSASESFAGKLLASTTPQPEAVSTQRRAVSNTRMSRAKTPEPLNLRPDSPSLLRHSGTPPLRSRRTRSGDLRTLGQSSDRSQSDLGVGAGASPSPVSGRTATPAAAANTPVPASSSSSSDLRSATTHAAAQTPTANPVANEGRLRSKDMADVYVSRLHSIELSCHFTNCCSFSFSGWLWRGPLGLSTVTHPTAQHAPPSEHAGARPREPRRAIDGREPCIGRSKDTGRAALYQPSHQLPCRTRQ